MLQKYLEILTRDEAIFRKKPDGTEVNYFLFPEFEIHINSLPGKTVQAWHKHHKIEEVLLVQSGKVKIEELENQQIVSRICAEGELIRMHNSLHRISNPDTLSASFTVFRFVPQGKNQQECIKNDKEEFSDATVQRLLKNK
ncbi:TPA: cupin domain-containing protein [Enterococcus faecalis]